MKCDVDIRKDMYAKVVLSDSAAMLQGIGEQMAKECNVSYAMVFFVFSNSERRSQLGHKVGPTEVSVRIHVVLTLLHSCIFSFVTELLCAFGNSSNAFALAQVAPQNRLPFDMVAER